MNTVWEKLTAAQLKELNAFCEDYRKFLSASKTERMFVKNGIEAAEKAGFRDISTFTSLKAGDRVYANNRGKNLCLFVIGTKPLTEGMNIVGAHIDSPRIDLKQNPFYEDSDYALADTHYYGGIKKYQWVTLPLALHGVVVKKDGTTLNIAVGEEEKDPVFCVTDLLIHLAQEQMEKKAAKVIEGEKLDILVGSLPLPDEDKNAVKAGILAILGTKYGITKDDFISAELTLVPAGRARAMGFDRSMTLGYGQDDRVCAFTSLRAMLDTKKTRRTACCLLVDKEEIGSVGATGMQSRFFENTLAELMEALGEKGELRLRRALANSKMLSSDVSSGFDPLYASAFDKKNVAYLGGGMVFNKFTGARGKSGSNDANAEYIAELRKIMDKHKVRFQTAELGRVDLGGGGTIAYIMSLYGMQVIDCGVPVLSMHAPWEVTSIVDLYEVTKGYRAFLAEA